ncbi:MAG TPA: aldehyde dehydrogenase [Metalysinibacillus jejuensis]|uniref:Aldehyde dehydrogenase n=1 Tax=Metalysinibacillus jejuensis TaxID=914327 RepID=A0A921NCB3_9BACL|nr:aldehyde dehydrogenase [Metalysinibacillus jejuensis]
MQQLITQQRRYYLSGATRDIAFRKQQLQQLKDSIVRHEPEILAALYEDLHKSAFEAYTTEVGLVLDSISYMIQHVDDWAKKEVVPTPLHLQPGKSFIVREPYGVVAIIAPFNYPFQLVMEPLIGAIVGGNTAIVKPSEMTPATTKIVRVIIEETFAPTYVAVVEGAKETVQTLIYAPVDYIFFTGSVAVGKIVARAAAERLTPIALELGGKSPAIVDHTAKIALAAKRIVWGKFTNAGQTCVAPDYVLVHRSIADEFVNACKKALTRFYGKHPEKSKDYGRIINTRHLDRLSALLQAQQQQVVHGGAYDRAQCYMAPTLLYDVNFSAPIMQDEIFGPLLPIIIFDDVKVALAEVATKPKPLAAYFFSEQRAAQQYFLEALPFGGGCINDTLTHVGSTALPFGGVGPSGVNSYHGKASFENFTHAKSIYQKSTKIEPNLVFPPYNNRLALVKKIIK